MCVSDVGESVIKQSVTAVAALSHSGVDRHKQAHTRTHTHVLSKAPLLLTKFFSLSTSDLSSVWGQ